MEYVNIMEAARRCRVSDKTIRRWIHAQKLRAQFPQPNRCEIAVSDLEPFLPGQLSGHGEKSLESRVANLEHQLHEVKQQMQGLLMRSTASKRKPSSSSRPSKPGSGSLPSHLVSAFAFAQLHQIPPQKVQVHIEVSLLPVHRGTWTDLDGGEILLAFDAKGQQAFHQLYHETSLFVACSQCPHALSGHV